MCFHFVGAWCEPILPASLTHGKPVCVCPCVQTGCALRVPSAPGKPSVCVKHFTKERGNFVLSCGWGEGSGGVSICPCPPGCNPPPHLSQVLSWGGNPPFTRCPLLLTWRLPVQLPASWIQYSYNIASVVGAVWCWRSAASPPAPPGHLQALPVTPSWGCLGSTMHMGQTSLVLSIPLCSKPEKGHEESQGCARFLPPALVLQSSAQGSLPW